MEYTDDPQVQTMIDNMPEKTGKSIEDWFKILKNAGLEKHGEMISLLKGEYSVSHGFANTIVLLFRQQQEGVTSDDDLVTAQYAKKPEMKALYDELIAAVSAFGKDVELAPKKAYVSLRRAKQFGILQPSTKSRMDIGVNLRGEEASGVLLEGDKWSGMCTHHIEVHTVDEITPEVVSWLRKAYENAG